MKKWSLASVLTIIALLITTIFIPDVYALDESSLDISKSADMETASIGDNITYTYVIVNTDNVTIEGLILTDDKLGNIPLADTTLAPGDNTTATANHTVVLADFPGPLENTATVSGTSQKSDNITASASTSVELIPYEESIGLTKNADRVSASIGDNITYTYVITNTGDLDIDDLSLTDDKLGVISLFPTTLAPGDNTTATANHTVIVTDFPGPLVNTATVSGKSQNSDNITASASTSVVLNDYDASIVLIKTADRTSASPHETIKYTYTLTNNSDVTINNLTLEDSRLGPISLSTTTIDPGDQIIVTADYTVKVGDLPGPIVNTATAEGEDPLGIPVYAASNQVSVSLTINWSLLTKAEILKLRGVPGKGIDTAPGLQKPFNPNSNAAENAGKKDSDNGPDEAPGLQKQFKLKSQAAEHAGKKK